MAHLVLYHPFVAVLSKSTPQSVFLQLTIHINSGARRGFVTWLLICFPTHPPIFSGKNFCEPLCFVYLFMVYCGMFINSYFKFQINLLLGLILLDLSTPGHAFLHFLNLCASWTMHHLHCVGSHPPRDALYKLHIAWLGLIIVCCQYALEPHLFK